MQYHYAVPFPSTTKANNQFSGNFSFVDQFNEDTLNDRFVFLRNPEVGLYKFSDGKLILPFKSTTVAEKKNPAFIGFRQSHHKNYTTTNILFNATDEKEKAGLIAFQNESHYYFLCKTIVDNNR